MSERRYLLFTLTVWYTRRNKHERRTTNTKWLNKSMKILPPTSLIFHSSMTSVFTGSYLHTVCSVRNIKSQCTYGLMRNPWKIFCTNSLLKVALRAPNNNTILHVPSAMSNRTHQNTTRNTVSVELKSQAKHSIGKVPRPQATVGQWRLETDGDEHWYESHGRTVRSWHNWLYLTADVNM
jgi:hypothetical protein